MLFFYIKTDGSILSILCRVTIYIVVTSEHMVLCFLPDSKEQMIVFFASSLFTFGARLLYNLSDNHMPFVYCTLVACIVQMKNVLIGRKNN
jgi:hypothetical protein